MARLTAAGVVLTAFGIAAPGAKVTKEAVTIDRDSRPYYLFVPGSVGSGPAPLLLVFHGSGRDGRSLVEPWRELAARERFIVAGPDAIDRRAWQSPADGPAFLYFLVETIKAKHAIDGRRMYLFGHSAGAWFGLIMSLMESEYFAATAVHAGGLQTEGRDQFFRAPRKIPMLIFSGTADQVVPIETAREARDVLAAHDFPVQLVTMAGHDHSYGPRADAINRQAWAFLQQHALEEEPHFQVYNYARPR